VTCDQLFLFCHQTHRCFGRDDLERK